MRNRYLDLLRAAAILRVIVYHLFGWPWLSILLPAMGIMFALAGSLTAASLDKRSAGRVITSRLRRLLPPLWLLAVIVVPTMLFLGWADENGGDKPLSWKLALWILPIGEPPGSRGGIDAWEPLWYVRAYLWFVVLSPLLYLAYKKIGWAAVAAPIVLIAVLDKTGFALPFGRADAAMWDFATYGACWIAGFAHHDGRLARIRPGLVVAVSAILGLAALYWLRGHAGEGGYDLNDVSESQALWSLAFVLPALRWQPDMSWLARNHRLDGMVNLLNARAVTIYLWHNIAIAAIWPVLTVLTLDDMGDLDGPTDLITALALTVVAVLAFGWVEDLAAGRRPRLWPTTAGGGRSTPPASSAGDPAPVAGDPAPVRMRSNGFGPERVRPEPVLAADRASSAGTGEFGPVDGVGGVAGGFSRPAGGGWESRSAGSGVGSPPSAGFPGSGMESRRGETMAPFPDAEVSFGLPAAGVEFSARHEDRIEVTGHEGSADVGGHSGSAGIAGHEDSADVAGHAALPPVIADPVPPPAQSRRPEPGERAAAGSWFTRETDEHS